MGGLKGSTMKIVPKFLNCGINLRYCIMIGGNLVFEELKAIDPHVIGVIASDYSNESIIANYSEYGFHAILTKPYTLDILREVLLSLPERVD